VIASFFVSFYLFDNPDRASTQARCWMPWMLACTHFSTNIFSGALAHMADVLLAKDTAALS
jgi:hypothetical protein